MAGHRVLLLLLLAAVLLVALAAVASADDAKPTILTPVAQTPLGSFEGDTPASDDAMDDDEDAAPVGAPTGATMTEPKPELTTPPGGGGAAAADAKGATSGASVLRVVAAHVGAVVAIAAGVFSH